MNACEPDGHRMQLCGLFLSLKNHVLAVSGSWEVMKLKRVHSSSVAFNTLK